jgi:co-chaperonin GroES (HSP10)
MKASIYFIVEVLDDYNNYTELQNGLKIAVNNSIESVEHINRIGKIVSVPKGVIAEEGDLLLFHHNICRSVWGLKGKKRPSNFHIKENYYYIPATEIFMIKKKTDSDWKALDPYVFVEPIPVEKVKLDNGLEVEEESHEGTKDLVGIMSYPNKALDNQGVKRGDKVYFQQDSQHKYIIEGKLFYKMTTQDILGIYEGS